jgi:glycosyltransferase involved in cell wall biosynthesis
MKAPLVSILIPAFDAARWIVPAINSAECQSWPNKEIIVVDDGSRDDTLAVARVAHQSGEGGKPGEPAARNPATRLPGRLHQWLDADDLLGLTKSPSRYGWSSRGTADAAVLA